MKIISQNVTETISNKVTSSALWVFLFQISDNLLGFIRLLVLARLLTPQDFGLVGIAWLVLQTISAFTQTGMHQSLIHKDDVNKYLNTVWTYLLFRGVVLYSLVFFITPLLGSFFNAPNFVDIIRAIGLTILFEGFINIGVIAFQKDLAFHKQFVYQIASNIVDFLVAVVLAIILKDVWAIVYGSIANSVVRVLLSYMLSPYRPRFEFKIPLFRELNNYGKWIAGSNVLQFIYSQGDDILVGRILGTIPLGLYQLAYKISNLPATQITHLISTVMFPAYAKIQSDQTRIGRIYLSVLQLTTFLSFFIGLLIIVFAQDFTILFLGGKWLPMVPAMQILTIWGLVRSIGATTGPVWQALGKPETVTKIQTIQVLILVAAIFPLTLNMGITGTALAVVISAIIPNIIAIYLISKTLQYNIFTVVKELLYPLLTSGVMALTVISLRSTIDTINIILFFGLAVIATLIYLAATFMLQKLVGYSIYQNIYKLLMTFSLPPKYNQILLKFDRLLR